jgi:hypothetical protein
MVPKADSTIRISDVEDVDDVDIKTSAPVIE